MVQLIKLLALLRFKLYIYVILVLTGSILVYIFEPKHSPVQPGSTSD